MSDSNFKAWLEGTSANHVQAAQLSRVPANLRAAILAKHEEAMQEANTELALSRNFYDDLTAVLKEERQRAEKLVAALLRIKSCEMLSACHGIARRAIADYGEPCPTKYPDPRKTVEPQPHPLTGEV